MTRTTCPILILALALSGPASAGVVPRASGPVAPRSATAHVSVPSDFAAQILMVHNRHRASVGAKPLLWAPHLAESAKAYGPTLASIGKLVHSPRAGRPGQSESLWRGNRGVYPVERMVEYWADERAAFRPGVFPNVSSTRDWLDVSHYTQMIWPDTTHVGCHLQTSRTHDMLICRYSPKGNQEGRVVGR